MGHLGGARGEGAWARNICPAVIQFLPFLSLTPSKDLLCVVSGDAIRFISNSNRVDLKFIFEQCGDLINLARFKYIKAHSCDVSWVLP